MNGMGRSAVRLVLAMTGALVLCGGGCDSETQRKIEETGNIFAPFQPPTPAEAARMATNPFDADQRLRGITLLAFAPFGGEEVYVRLYEQALGMPPVSSADEDPGVRAAAARALARHGGPQHVPWIVPLLQDRDPRIRAEAARALQRLHNPVAIDPLIDRTRAVRTERMTSPDGRVVTDAAGQPMIVQRANEPDAAVRAEAAVALAQYADPRVLQALIAALSDDSLLVTRAASTSLTTLTGQEFGEDPRAWLRWLNQRSDNPFAERRQFVYPVFQRDRYWFEWLPLIPPPPNETPGSPAGMGPAILPPS
jgi:hypothetical protein